MPAMNLRHSQTGLAFLLAIAVVQTAPAQTPSFNCTKASSLREHTVCASPKLSAQDTQVASAYKAELARLSPASAALVRADQREWLQWLDQVCSAKKPYGGSVTNCLQSQYTRRLSQLREPPPVPGEPAFYTRTSFILVPSKDPSQNNATSNDPGFGTGDFAWPQIENPSPAQTNWNQAILAAAIKTTADKEANPAPTNFASSVDPSGTISVSVAIIAANDRLIVARIVDSSYGYGAAHPNTSDIYVSWWLDPGHELTVNDIFRLDQPGWQSHLVSLIHEKLKPDLSQNDELWNAANIQKSIAGELGNPHAWSISREGFTLHFGQYEIGPYAIGMPSATLLWKDLDPFLAPNLHPETLPPPAPKANP